MTGAKGVPMFVALYRWRLKPNKENEFRQAWTRVTIAFREKFGSLGSRLHRSEDGTWVAYAQWPNKKVWESARTPGSDSDGARAQMQDAIAETLPTLYLTVTEDFLSRRVD
jgi:quinol monooxygenase YgiN